MTSRLSLLADLLSLWHERLRTWAADGRLAEAVQLALQGSAASPVLDSLLSRWQQGDFSDLPSVHVLDHALLGEALGAYGNGQILLNRQWLEASSNTQLFTVLTEELGHHLDQQLNPANDTPGDEGELFARLLLNPTSLDGPTLARIQAETDQRILRTPEGPIAMELADNTAPTAVQLSSTNINEGEAAGAVVGNLASVDANSGDTFTYTLVSGSGSDDNGAFSINQYNQLVANSSLDREQKASYKVRVRSTDAGGLFTEQAFVITVNNLQDPIKLKDLGSISLTSQATSTTLDLSTYFDDPFSTGQVAKFTLNPALQKAIASNFSSIPALQAKTSIDVVLFDQSGAGAPLSAANLAQYVNAGRYINTIFHRLVPGFVIQGGGFTWADGAASPSQVTTFPNLQNEYNSNRANIRGTVAMAKLGGDPNSATSQWFFNLANNTANLDNQNGGFTVIGRTKTATDLTLMDIFSVSETPLSQNTSYQNSVFKDIPLVGLDSTSTSIGPSNTLRFSNISIEKQNELSHQQQQTRPAGSQPQQQQPDLKPPERHQQRR